MEFWDAQRQEGKIISTTHQIMDEPGNIHRIFVNGKIRLILVIF